MERDRPDHLINTSKISYFHTNFVSSPWKTTNTSQNDQGIETPNGLLNNCGCQLLLLFQLHSHVIPMHPVQTVIHA